MSVKYKVRKYARGSRNIVLEKNEERKIDREENKEK